MRSFVLRAVALATALAAIACEHNAALDPMVEAAKISLSTRSLSLAVDEEQQLTIATSLPAGTAVTWQSLDQNVAVVSTSGMVTGRSIGVTRVVAYAKRSTDTATVSVHAVATKVSLSVDSTTVPSGKAFQLGYTAYDKNGQTISNIGNNSGKWASSLPAVATVSSAGLVTAYGVGRTAVTFTVNGSTGLAWVRVTPAQIAKVLVSPSPSLSVSVGRSAQLSAIATDANGNVVTGRPATWTSSDTTTIVVSSTGTVSARKTGTATIAVVVDSQKAQTSVTASPVLVASVSVLLNNSSITSGQTTQAVATARDSLGNVITGRAVSWSSSDPSVATVAPSGAVTAVAAGSTAITATVDGVVGSASLAVTVPTVAAVGVVLGSSSISVGQTTQATATATDALGNPITGLPVAWSTSNAALATVSSSGLVTAVGGGIVSIIATVNGKTGSATLVSVAVAISSVNVSVPSTTVVTGGTVQATATVIDASGSSSTTPVVWSSSAPLVATVSSTGLVNALSAGSVTISAAAGGKSGSANLTIQQATSPTGPTLSPPSGGDAELPRVFLNTAMSATPSAGRIIHVAAGGDLQGALDSALPGDQVLLAAGATYRGNFVLWPKSGGIAGGWVTVMTEGCALPPEGTRTSPAAAACYAKLVSNSVNGALSTRGPAKFWRVIGIEFTNDPSQSVVYNTVMIGDASTAQNSLSQVPSDIILDRVYVHSPDNTDDRRCIGLNSARTAVIDSYVSNCKSAFDAQAITGTNGPGPFKIVNNYLEATGENIAFGGADAHIQGLVPSDMEIRRNYFSKQLAWKSSTQWIQKNLIESKNSQRVLFEANVLENTWVGAQVGWTFGLWSVNQDGGCPWCVTSDWTIRNNLVRNVASFVSVIDRWDASTQPAHHITIRNNVVIGLNAANVDGAGRVFNISNVPYLTIENNTAFSAVSPAFAWGLASPTGTVIRNNVVAGYYAVFSASGLGSKALASGAGSDAIFLGNVVTDNDGILLNPIAGNAFLTSMGAIGLANPNNWNSATASLNDLALASTSPYKGKGTDGKDPGADMNAIAAATAGVKP